MSSTAPLLVVDGDSFAHRAYHALPKQIRLNAVVGFTNMLTRMWEMERPRAVIVGWDSIGTPTYRNEALPGYQAGGSSTTRCSSSSTCCRRACRRWGS